MQPDSGAAQNQLWQNLGQNAAGVLNNDWRTNQISNLSQQWFGNSGFGVDTNAANAAFNRASDLQSYDLQKKAVDDYIKLSSALPESVDVSKFMISPALLEQQRQGEIANALRAYQLANPSPGAAGSIEALLADKAQRDFGAPRSGAGLSLGSDFGQASAGPAGGEYNYYSSPADQIFGTGGGYGYDVAPTQWGDIAPTSWGFSESYSIPDFTDYGYEGPIA